MDAPIGTALKEWQSYVTTISRNVMELSEKTDVKLIKLMVTDTASGYTGLTKNKALKALEDLEKLWRYYALLSVVIDKAVDLYNKDSFLRDTEEEVKELLNTPITIETEHIDISNRSLLAFGNKEIKVSLQELLKLMQDIFESARNVFDEISRSTKNMRIKLESIKNELSSLSNKASSLGIKVAALPDVNRIVNIERDPLRGLLELDSLYFSLEEYRGLIDSAIKDYNETVDRLSRASDMLCEIEDLAEKSQTAVIESQEIFGKVYSAKPVISQDVLKSLRDWLSVLEDKVQEGSLNAAKVGALRLENECSLKLEIEKANYYSNSKDYNEWLDLRGEFKALIVKFNWLKAKGISFDNSLNALIEELNISLNGDRVELAACRLLIEKFRMSLRS